MFGHPKHGGVMVDTQHTHLDGQPVGEVSYSHYGGAAMLSL